MNKIFISYSHQDEEWKDRVQSHLTVLEKHEKLSIWDDRQIPLGGDWLADIEQSLEDASIALLLISRYFLSSDFILQKEIPDLLKRRKESGLTVIPIMLTPCSWDHVDWLKSIQGYPKNNSPLSGMTDHQADDALAKLSSHLASSNQYLNAIAVPETQTTQPQTTAVSSTVINNFSGITLEQYEGGLLRQEKRLREEFRAAIDRQDTTEEQTLQIELNAIQNKLLNLQASYQETQTRLREADDALEQLKNELPPAQIETAQELLAKNDTQAAKQAFNDILEKGAPSMALAAYESGRLEEEDINYNQAMKQYRIAVTLEEDNPDYLLVAGQMAYILGEYSKAESLFKSLLQITKSAPYDPLGVATCKFDLAKIYKASGKYQESESLYQSCLEIFEKVLPKNHSTIATVLNNLAELFRSQGKHIKAEPLYQRSISIHKKNNNEDSEAASALNNLAELYRLQGKNTEAKPLYEKSLSIFENCLGEDHPNFATSLNNLALIYIQQKLYSKAESLLLRSMSIIEKTLGRHHHLLGNSLNNLADLYQLQSLYEKAEPLYMRDLSITEKSLGRDHPDYATTLNNLGKLYLQQGKLKEAESLFRRSLSIYEGALGKDHPDVATVLSNISTLLFERSKLSASIRYMKKAINIWEKKLPDNHPNLIQSKRNLEFLKSQ